VEASFNIGAFCFQVIYLFFSISLDVTIFNFRANEIDLDYKFGVCFYDAASDTLLKDYYLQSEGRNDIFGHFDTEFYGS